MNTEIKKYVDAGDAEKLKIIFTDALDVDPTFKQYQEEYEYCREKRILEPYIELTPFQTNEAMWNEEYWMNLKWDLQKNFSDTRMTHMCEVAKVFYAKKIQRIQQERESIRQEQERAAQAEKLKVSDEKQEKNKNVDCYVKVENEERKISGKEEQDSQKKKAEENVEEKNLERHNRAVAESKSKAGRGIENKNKGLAENNKNKGGNDSKKVKGVAIEVLLIVIIVLLLIKWCNPRV